MLKNKRIFLIAALALIVSSVSAQTNSPYSRYGYGILKDQAVGPSKAMGGIGYGLRQNYGANPMNPASYSNVDSLTFLFDIGISYNKAKLSEGGASQNDDNGGLDYVTILFPVSKRLGVSAGVIPYSSVGYSFGKQENLGTGIDYIKHFEGSGGLNQVYLGLGYETPFLKGLSFGGNISYLFGKLEHKRNLPAIGVPGSYTSTQVTDLKIKAVKFDLGLQYEFAVSPKKRLTLGALYSPQINSKGDYSFRSYLYDGTSLAQPIVGDTIKDLGAGIPSTLGFGFTLVHNSQWTVGADVTYQKWDNVKYPPEMGDELTSSERFNNRWKYSIGGEYMIDPYDRNFFKRMRFRGGLSYGNSYLNVKQKDASGITIGDSKGYDEFGATIGFGLPIMDRIEFGGRTSYINVTFEYRRVNPEVKTMIKEEYFGVSLGVNINELWFVKRKIY